MVDTAFSSFSKTILVLFLISVVVWSQHAELLKHGKWTVQSPDSCSSLPALQVNGPGTLFDPANASALSDLQHALAAPLAKVCPGVREAILVNGRGRKFIRIESAVAPAQAAAPGAVSPVAKEAPAVGATAPTGAEAVPPPATEAKVQSPPHPAPVQTSVNALISSVRGIPESPFVDFVQFRNQSARRPMASEHHNGIHYMGRVPESAGAYALGQFVSIIGRALNNKDAKLVLERLPNGKWIPATVRFTMPDASFYVSGYPLMGRIIASKPSEFEVTFSEDGIVTGKQAGSTDDLSGAGLGYQLKGSITWTGTETLDLNSGLDNWNFESKMAGREKGTLTASDSVRVDFAIVPGIDESRTKGDENVASDPANPRALIISDLKFRSSKGLPTLRFSDHGVLSVSLVNRAGLDLNELHYNFTTAEKVDGILDPGRLSGALVIARDSNLDLSPMIGTSFGIPAGVVNFVFTISYRNTVLGRKTLSLPTEPFYRDTDVHLPDASAPRLTAVAKYFGTGGAPYGEPGYELAASAGRDPLASMWEATFQSQGVAGYTFDQEKAYQAARKVLPQLEERARGGDAEGLYLFFYACQLGLEGENAQVEAGQFLDRAAAAGFLPAKFDRARLLSLGKDDVKALATLKEVYDAGVKRAAFVIGRIYEQGRGVERNPQIALKWYRTGAEFGDPAAILGLANLTASGVGDIQPDPAKAMELARQAASRKYSGGYLFIGRAYASGRQGVKQDTAAAVKAFKAAADFGDRDGMLALGKIFLGDAPGFTPDERAGVYWIRQAAERDSPEAMVILWNFYVEGKGMDKSLVAARYWYNQAALHGLVPGDNRGLEAQRQVFLDFWRSADFSPSYVYVNHYGSVVGDSGDGMLNGLLGGMLGAMTSYYGRQQTMIAGLEFIQKRNGKKIYGGTISSPFTSKLQLRAGQTISIRTYGVISTGMFSGARDANGLGSAWPEYRFVPNLPTSALIGRVGDSPWQLVGTHAEIVASTDGAVAFCVNGRDYQNYKGYFDVVVEVPDEE